MVNSDIVHSKAGWSPKKIYEITVAEMVERRRGRIELMEILNRRISRVKRTPARGALNMPATAPAAPHPRRIVIFLYDRFMYLATFEPIAAPVYTIGASAPTDPPNPIVTDEASIEDHMLWGLILDSFLETA